MHVWALATSRTLLANIRGLSHFKWLFKGGGAVAPIAPLVSPPMTAVAQGLPLQVHFILTHVDNNTLLHCSLLQFVVIAIPFKNIPWVEETPNSMQSGSS